VEITPATAQRLERAWIAVTAPTPALLASLLDDPDFISGGTTLHHALAQIPARFPDTSSGLSRYDARLLTNAREHGPDVPRVIGHTLAGAGWDSDPVGDGWLYWRLRRMADRSLRAPLLSIKSQDASYRGATVSLTSAGLNVLDGAANHYVLNGIDDWIGGMHLDSSAGRVWFQTNGSFAEETI
jgi:hypothetical protein